VFFVLYPLGIPLFLGSKLWRNRETVHNAPDYVGIAHYKPLSQSGLVHS
jgi:hypothetical protein